MLYQKLVMAIIFLPPLFIALRSNRLSEFTAFLYLGSLCFVYPLIWIFHPSFIVRLDMVILVLAFITIIPKISSSNFNLKAVIPALCIFGIVPTIGYAYSGLSNFTLTIYFSLILTLASFLVGKSFTGNLQKICKIVVWSGFCLTIYATLEVLGIVEKYQYTDWYRVYKSTEASSLLGVHPSHYGFFMGLTLFSGSHILLYGQKISAVRYALYCVLFLFCLYGAFLSNSRSAILFTLSIFGLSIFYSLELIRYRLLTIALITFGLIVSFSEIYALIELSELTSSTRSESAANRVDIWLEAINFQFKDFFLIFFGLGFGNFGAVLAPQIGFSASHNQLVNLFVEFGVIGSFLWGYVLINYYTHLSKKNPFKVLFLALIIASIGSETFLPVKAFESFSMLIFFFAGIYSQFGQHHYSNQVLHEN